MTKLLSNVLKFQSVHSIEDLLPHQNTESQETKIMYNIEDLTEQARRSGASDIHLVCGLPPKYRLDGQLENMAEERLSEKDCDMLCQDLAKDAMYEKLEYTGELDFSREIRETAADAMYSNSKAKFPQPSVCSANLFKTGLPGLPLCAGIHQPPQGISSGNW